VSVRSLSAPPGFQAAHEKHEDLLVAKKVIFVGQSVDEWIQAAVNKHNEGKGVV